MGSNLPAVVLVGHSSVSLTIPGVKLGPGLGLDKPVGPKSETESTSGSTKW